MTMSSLSQHNGIDGNDLHLPTPIPTPTMGMGEDGQSDNVQNGSQNVQNGSQSEDQRQNGDQRQNAPMTLTTSECLQNENPDPASIMSFHFSDVSTSDSDSDFPSTSGGISGECVDKSREKVLD